MDASHVRKRHVSLSTQQHRLRHLKGIFARNIDPDSICGNKDGFTIYYSICHIPSNKVIYTSEVITDCLNPSWGLFEMSHFPDDIPSSTSSICVQVWCHTNGQSMHVEPKLIIEWTIALSGLSYLGEQIPKDGKMFNSNSLIFFMVEGYYSSDNCLVSATKSKLGGEFVIVEANSLRPSYNVSCIQRIHTVQRATRQTKSAIRKEWEQIRAKLIHLKERKHIQAEKELKEIKVHLLKQKLKQQEVLISNLSERVQQLRFSQENERSEITQNFETLKKSKQSLNEDYKEYINVRENLLKTKSHVSLRWKQLIPDLVFIYPIVEVPDKPYKICDVSLPNSEDFAGTDAVMISVGLGYVTHIILMLSRLLNVPLRYPVHHFGSRSTVMDHIIDKIEPQDRVFPLFTKGKNKIHFTYGVYLLNKNIAQLRHYSGLQTKDLRATLPNLLGIIELLLKERFGVRGERYISHPPGNYIDSLSVNRTILQNQKSSEHSQSTSSGNATGKSPVIHKLNDKYIEYTAAETLKKVSSAAEMAAASKNSTGEYSSSSISKEAILILNHQLPRHHLGKVQSSVSNSFSCSLDQGLNNLSMSSSPVRHVNNVEVHPLSTSHSDIGALNGDHKESFYKASVNMWKNTPSSDDEVVSSHQNSNEMERTDSKISPTSVDVPVFYKEKDNSFKELNATSARDNAVSEPKKGLVVQDDCDDIIGGVLSCQSKFDEIVNNFNDDRDSFDCDIASRVELLAQRSGSFKQLQPSKSYE